MSNREEMRWKFQQIQQLIETARLEHEKERENKRHDWDDLSSQVTIGRNTLLGGIGFAILLIVALSAIDEIPKDSLWVIAVLIVIGLTLFVGVNVWLGRIGKKVYQIDEVYEKQILDMIGVEGWFVGCSIDESITPDQLAILILFMHDYTQALSYLLKDSYYKIHKVNHLEHENFKIIWNDVKNRYDTYKKFNNTALEQINNFINVFEVNDEGLPEGITKNK